VNDDQQDSAVDASALAVALGLLLAVLLTFVVRGHGRPFALDTAVRGQLAWVPRAAAEIVTQCGAGPVLYPVLLALVVRRWQRRDGRGPGWAALPIAAVAAAQILEGVLFVTLPRTSPAGGPGASSFSSGHAAAAALAWGLVTAHLLARVSSSRRRTAFVLAAGAVAGFAVGASRIALGAHWFTDVVGAVSFGLLLLVGVMRADRHWPPAVSPGHVAATSRHFGWTWWLPAGAALAVIAPLWATPGSQRMKDLLVYQGAGGVAGAGADVYGFRTVFDMPFTYPPFAALLAEPLSRMPVGLGQALWIAATLAAAVAFAHVALAPVVARLGLPATTAALLVSAPLRSSLRFGQVGLFLALLVAVDLLRAQPPSRRGLGLGMAVAVKLTPIVFLPWLLLTGQRQRFRRTVAWLVGLSVAGLLLLWRSAGDYVWHASRDTTRFGANAIPGNQSLRGMLLRTPLPESFVSPLWFGLSLLLVVIGTYGAVRLARQGCRLAAVGVLACLSVAVSPISWVHHLVWLAFGLAALVAAGRGRLALGWYLLLLPGLPALAASAQRSGHGPAALWALGVDAQGLSAVAAVLLLPALCRPADA
jgi:membrane-associated phospholipid phosphatase